MRSLLSSRNLSGAIAALAAACLAISVANAQQPAPGRSKVVLQMSEADPAKWNLALNNAKNIQADLGAASVDAEIVAYMLGKIGYVSSGVVEIMQRQQQGWAYIRP